MGMRSRVAMMAAGGGAGVRIIATCLMAAAVVVSGSIEPHGRTDGLTD